MTGLLRFPSIPPTPAAVGRLRLALAVSALAHLALLAVPLGDTRRPGAAPAAIAVPMTARISPPPVAVPGAPPVTDAEVSRVPGPAAASSAPARSDLLATVAAPAALRVPDPTYYAARELDAYPHPAQPLALDRLPGAGRIRLLLLIDEHGIVNDVSLAEANAAGRLDAALHATLTAARFLPAQKNGLAVRSRIVLSVGFDPRNGER